MLRAAQLFPYVDGTAIAPSQFCMEDAGADACQVPSPDCLPWFTQDQVVLSLVLSSMTEEILGQLTQCTTSRAVWEALHTMFSSQNRARVLQVR